MTMPSCLPAAHLAVTPQPYERASPSVSTGNEDALHSSLNLGYERTQEFESSRRTCSFGCELSSRTIATNSQLGHANDLNPGRSSQRRI
jgi:hypothetical protein